MVGGGLDQHHARGGAPLADELVGFANAAAAGGEEVSPDALARNVLARGREFIGNLRPVAFQFLGAKLAQAGQSALPHFRTGDTNDDAFIGLDHHPGVNLGAGDLCRGFAPERDMKAEGEACGSGTDKEGAAVQFGYVIHNAVLPYALPLAAAWIAARTCWKVPHRQILVIASSMSASVGFGFSFSSADTAMIMPLWQ